MKSQVLHTVWCNIPGEAAGEIWNWSPSVVRILSQNSNQVAQIQTRETDGRNLRGRRQRWRRKQSEQWEEWRRRRGGRGGGRGGQRGIATFFQPFNEKCMCEVGRIASIIIFHLSKLWKAKFFILCGVIFVVRLQGKFDIDHPWEWKGYGEFTLD